MWKLTIVQERASEHGEYTLTEKVEFMNEDLSALTIIVARFAECEEVHETEYKIEKVGEK